MIDQELLKKKPSQGCGFIYCYISPSNKRYIGKTINSLKMRAGNQGKGYKNCSILMRAFEKYGYENFTIEILEEVPYELLNEREKYFINFYDSMNPEKGYNIKPGGAVEYSSNQCATKRIVYRYDLQGNFIESFESINEAGRKMGIPYQVISQNCRKEITHYKDSVYRYAEDDSPFSQVIPKLTHGRKTAQYNLDGELINIYPSANAAAIAIGKPSSAGRNIRAVCEGKRKTTFGYKWSYLD